MAQPPASCQNRCRTEAHPDAVSPPAAQRRGRSAPNPQHQNTKLVDERQRNPPAEPSRPAAQRRGRWGPALPPRLPQRPQQAQQAPHHRWRGCAARQPPAPAAATGEAGARKGGLCVVIVGGACLARVQLDFIACKQGAANHRSWCASGPTWLALAGGEQDSFVTSELLLCGLRGRGGAGTRARGGLLMVMIIVICLVSVCAAYMEEAEPEPEPEVG